MKKKPVKKSCEDRYAAFSRAVTTLIKINETDALRADPFNAVQKAIELQTVCVNAGRQTGKTTYAARVAGKDDLIVVGTYDHAKHFKVRFPRTKATVVSASGLRNVAIGRRFKRIFIDEPQYVFEEVQKRELYKMLAFSDDQTFILLGAQ